MNPCRCGSAYEPGYSCKRGRIDRCTADYQGRISGPLMDRIDLRIEVPAVTAADLILPPPAEGSAEVAARVAAARDIQRARYAAAGLPQVRTNAEAPAAILDEIAQPDAQGQKLLRDAAETMRLSARGYHRVLRVARTLADLDGAVDLLVANPPYIPSAAELEPEVAQHDPRRAVFGGPDGMAVIAPVVELAARWLRPGGVFAVEHDDTTAARTVEMVTGAGCFDDVPARLDLTGRPRFVTARKKGSTK
jgi:magnesium chelatase family protein